MKLLLSKLTALALVSVSSTYALEWPSFLRGTNNADVEASLESDCEDGYFAGRADVDKHWNNVMKQNCDKVWGLEAEGEKIKKNKYPSNPSDWRKSTYNQCGRTGVDERVAEIEKQCLHDDSSQCTDLGNDAAEIIVLNGFCTPGGTYGAAHEQPNYKAECKDAATTICMGNIPNVAHRWCPDKNLSMGKMKELQGKCEDQVDKMVPGAESTLKQE
mmetsp:Transcript_10310/g.22327  ORF Transcript_10310/g.22327 Transcript_10310/m.22327 type:complete len:216 (+) Transcript_10310:128-775(+)|eukprot:CAMPEP_0183743006 /NCGR_PEP_ID=MMETSP0737-20130205/64995_1 /TAXON_ID=385413 /ORGANISM="Thalassiosira miniscula, Strain CCMP1093" /LENGTH=215 /DNA_ID=CAMNT_0025978609 /DNA_START=95 /DNA_END=742 /DNA_ORIENTATION=-